MIACITDKHAVLFSVGQLAAQLVHIVHNGNLSKNVEGVEEHWVSLVEAAEGWILANLGSQIFHLGCHICTPGPQPLEKVFMLVSESGQVEH